MQGILKLLEILLIIVTLGVVVSYIIRRYELGNREARDTTGYVAPSAFEKALGIAGEIVAVFLSVLLYPFGYVAGERSPARLRPGERPLILCHGYRHNRSAFFLLRYRLRKAGWGNVVVPNFRPVSASVPHFAEQLSEKARLAMSDAGCDKVDLVGHSMGGLVVRYFIEKLGGASCVGTAITVGAPHRGTKMAALGLFKTADQFRTDSSLIKDLCGQASSHGSVNVVSVWSDFDNMVLPPENAMLPQPCDSFMVRGVGHVAMLFSGQVFERLRLALSGHRTE
jgi:predicted alpha/beta hydrolase family esterase